MKLIDFLGLFQPKSSCDSSVKMITVVQSGKLHLSTAIEIRSELPPSLNADKVEVAVPSLSYAVSVANSVLAHLLPSW